MPSDCIVSSRDQLIAGTKDYDPEKLTWHDMINQGYLTPYSSMVVTLLI